MKKTLAFLLAIGLITFAATPAFALDLATAKKEGLVGEMTDGMIGPVFSNPSREVLDLVASTNAGRLAVYQDMATKQKLTLTQIKTMAATKLYEKEAPGNYIQINGEWSVKRASR